MMWPNPNPQWLTIAVFGALPSLGLIAGPSYAALIFGLGLVQAITSFAKERRLRSVDPYLGLLGLAFAALCWASVMWSIDPPRSEHAALQTTLVLAGALLFLTTPPLTDEAAERVFRVMAAATIAGTMIFVIDTAVGYKLQLLLLGRPHPDPGAKYNRGIDHLVLIAWPQLAFMAQRRDWRRGVILAVCLAIVVGLGLSLAAQLAAAVGALVLVLAWWLPRLIGPALTGGTVLLAAGLPMGLRLAASHRMEFASHLKRSGLHRLEIWDFMTARVAERPLLGWGIADASVVPITQEEMSHYVIQGGAGIYPHNQWLQLWVETGAVGAAMGLVLALLVLARIRRLPSATRPFAYAAFGSAIAVSCVNFEVMTDSWWAAMAATGYLFAAIPARDAVLSTDIP